MDFTCESVKKCWFLRVAATKRWGFALHVSRVRRLGLGVRPWRQSDWWPRCFLQARVWACVVFLPGSWSEQVARDREALRCRELQEKKKLHIRNTKPFSSSTSADRKICSTTRGSMPRVLGSGGSWPKPSMMVKVFPELVWPSVKNASTIAIIKGTFERVARALQTLRLVWKNEVVHWVKVWVNFF